MKANALQMLKRYVADIDGVNDEGMIQHDCEMYSNPEAGGCSICDMWVEVMQATREIPLEGMVKHPSEIVWIDGELPDPNSVERNSLALAWFVRNKSEASADMWARSTPAFGTKEEILARNGQFSHICAVHIEWDDIHKWRWCDDGGMPVGFEETVKHYAWVRR